MCISAISPPPPHLLCTMNNSNLFKTKAAYITSACYLSSLELLQNCLIFPF